MSKWILGIFITVLFWGLCWYNIGFPQTYNFDEQHYVPAAIAYLNSSPILNVEHPPLAKIIIAEGIAFLGNHPSGWRLMSSFFGALTLAGIYLWSLQLFNSKRTAFFATLITAANQMLYVQSRIAMLDTFMTAFLVWGALTFSYWWKHKEKKWIFYVSSFFWGLAMATKLFAAVPFGVLGILLLVAYSKEKNLSFYSMLVFFMLLFIQIALKF